MPKLAVALAGGQNVAAFLDAIAISELGPAVIAGSDDGYNVLVGSTSSHILTFDSYATHPNILNAQCDSTAAGRYQLLHRYFAPYAAQLKLKDFGPVAQDQIAIQQLKECGALPFLQAGNLPAAIARAGHIWASMPGSPYGQHTHPMDYLVWAFKTSGGQIHGTA